MPTPFAGRIWQKETFTFTAHSEPRSVDSRGNASSQGVVIALTFKMRPSGSTPQKGEAADTGVVPYECRLVAIDGDDNKFILPSQINIGDVGEGQLNGRRCVVIIRSVSQSSVSPILERILGSSVTLEVDYRIRRGSSASV